MKPALPGPVLREIWLTQELSVSVLDQVFFQSGENGVHQWESGIVLSRYLIFNSERFASKSILELGSGSGLTSITISKYLLNTQVQSTDYNPTVLANIQSNAQLNQCHLSPVRLDWTDSSSYLPRQFDYVIGSDLIYDGAPLMDLSRTVQHHLAPSGEMILVMPVKRHMTQVFIDVMLASGFTHEQVALDAEELKAAPSASGYRDFPELKTHAFLLHSFSRRS